MLVLFVDAIGHCTFIFDKQVFVTPDVWPLPTPAASLFIDLESYRASPTWLSKVRKGSIQTPHGLTLLTPSPPLLESQDYVSHRATQFPFQEDLGPHSFALFLSSHSGFPVPRSTPEICPRHFWLFLLSSVLVKPFFSHPNLPRLIRFRPPS